MRTTGPMAAPTIDLTIHFRAPLAHAGRRRRARSCAWCRTRTGVIHDGFFEEDG